MCSDNYWLVTHQLEWPAVLERYCRVYETEKITQKLRILGIVIFAVCEIGPCTTFFPQCIDVALGKWIWNIGNKAGISMTIFCLFQFGINHFTLENVSKEYILKCYHRKKSVWSKLMTELHFQLKAATAFRLTLPGIDFFENLRAGGGGGGGLAGPR